jgi:hypothetical protein
MGGIFRCDMGPCLTVTLPADLSTFCTTPLVSGSELLATLGAAVTGAFAFDAAPEAAGVAANALAVTKIDVATNDESELLLMNVL